MTANEKIHKITSNLGISSVKASEIMKISYTSYKAKEKNYKYNKFNDKNYQDLINYIRQFIYNKYK